MNKADLIQILKSHIEDHTNELNSFMAESQDKYTKAIIKNLKASIKSKNKMLVELSK